MKHINYGWGELENQGLLALFSFEKVRAFQTKELQYLKVHHKPSLAHCYCVNEQLNKVFMKLNSTISVQVDADVSEEYFQGSVFLHMHIL